MAYYVDEDIAHDTAIVHRENCDWAQGREERTKSGRWLGPYAIGDLAINAASETGLGEVRLCRVCQPQLISPGEL